MSYAFPDTDFDRTLSHEPDEYELRMPMPSNRRLITSEAQVTGDHFDPRFPDFDWVGSANYGGGAVPADLEWRSDSRHDRLPDRDGN